MAKNNEKRQKLTRKKDQTEFEKLRKLIPNQEVCGEIKIPNAKTKTHRYFQCDFDSIIMHVFTLHHQ